MIHAAGEVVASAKQFPQWANIQLSVSNNKSVFTHSIWEMETKLFSMCKICDHQYCEFLFILIRYSTYDNLIEYYAHVDLIVDVIFCLYMFPPVAPMRISFNRA